MSTLSLDDVNKIGENRDEALEKALESAGSDDLIDASPETRKNYFYWAWTWQKALNAYKEQTNQYVSSEEKYYEKSFFESWTSENV